MASVANERANPTTALPPMEVVAEKEPKTNKTNATGKRVLLALSCVLLIVGCCGGPLIMRLYFLHGGNLVWLSSWLQSAGCPVILIPLTVSYLRRRSANPNTKVFYTRPLIFFCTVVIGLLTGLDSYLYSYGVARVPVSTSSLIFASQLAFTALFACLLVRQKFTPYSSNAVVLLTVGSGILALHTSSDKPLNESNKQYSLGFIMTLVASFLYGLILPLIELTYMKAEQEITYTLVMEIQLIMGLFAAMFCTIGMIATNEFQAIVGEAREFGIGESKYYLVLVLNAIIWQCFYAGAVGVIFCSSSLFSGVIVAALLPVTEVLAVIFYHERFSGEKGVSLALSLWGFLSYFYGEARQSKNQKKKNNHLISETEMLPALEINIVPNPTSSV